MHRQAKRCWVRIFFPFKVSNLLETNVAGIGGEIQLTNGLDELLTRDWLNPFENDAGIYECGNK